MSGRPEGRADQDPGRTPVAATGPAAPRLAQPNPPTGPDAGPATRLSAPAGRAAHLPPMPGQDAAAERRAGFLAAAGWGQAAGSPLTGDASHRRYERLIRPDGARAILMILPPGAGAEITGFTRIARHLAARGLSAPRSLAEDAAAGLLLLEDLGDDLFARLLAADPGREAELYAAAVDLLPLMEAPPAPPGLPVLDAATLGSMTAPVLDWYAAGHPGEGAGRGQDRLAGAIAEAADRLLTAPRAFAHRDYHAENLLWLPERAGPARVGLLDFQDAVLADPAYDLASLLRDARRDVSEAARAAMMRRAAGVLGREEAALAAAAALLSVQRNLRILGIFARLAVRDGKAGYLALIPRVWGHLAADLAHPALAGLRPVLDLPPPEARLPALRELAR